jgi:hypothetical protein
VACIVPVLRPINLSDPLFRVIAALCSCIQTFYCCPKYSGFRSVGITGHDLNSLRHSSGFTHAHLAGKAHSFHTSNFSQAPDALRNSRQLMVTSKPDRTIKKCSNPIKEYTFTLRSITSTHLRHNAHSLEE